MGAHPLGGGFGHFYAYPERRTPLIRWKCNWTGSQSAEREFICGDEYTIADIAIHPWYGALAMGMLYESGQFLDVGSYKNVQRWTKAVQERPAVRRGQNRVGGDEAKRLPERA